MCYILNKKNATILSAEKDIEVAKYGIKTDFYSLVSIPNFKRYTFGVEECESHIELFSGPAPEEFLTGRGLYSIRPEDASNAYHGGLYNYVASNYYRARFNHRGQLYKFVVCKAIIPKGSKYIQYPFGYVSDKLIVLDEIIPNEICLNPEVKFYNELKEIFY